MQEPVLPQTQARPLQGGDCDAFVLSFAKWQMFMAQASTPTVIGASDSQKKLVTKYQTNLTGLLWNPLVTVLIGEVQGTACVPVSCEVKETRNQYLNPNLSLFLLLWDKSFNYIYLIVCVCVHAFMHACTCACMCGHHDASMGARGQISGVLSVLLPCGSQGLTSGCLVRQQLPLPTEQSHCSDPILNARSLQPTVYEPFLSEYSL